jgi:predicted CoA-binding protein
MIMKITIDAFLADPRVALVGASRDKAKWGNALMRELVAKGVDVLPVNPRATEIEGRKCYPSLDALPPEIAGAIVALPAPEAAKALTEAENPSLKRVWLLRGASSEASISAARAKGLEIVSKYCPLMFYPPVDGAHKFHRFFARLFGSLPH